MKPVVIFGADQNSQVASYYLQNDTNFEILAHCVDDEFIDKVDTSLLQYEVLSWNNLIKKYNNSEINFFAPLYGGRMGKNRMKIYNKIKDNGYSFISYISSRSNIFTKNIGENCLILEGNTLQPFTRIGNNVSIWSNNHIGHHTVIEDHATITSHVIISGNCTIGENSFLGVNSSIKDGIKLGKYSFIGMGANITRNTEDESVYTAIASEKRSISSLKLRY
tara:strand:- start:5643 stop:6305 length:663 start_codon:yes stop_codon:yes gene_type:complete